MSDECPSYVRVWLFDFVISVSTNTFLEYDGKVFDGHGPDEVRAMSEYVREMSELCQSLFFDFVNLDLKHTFVDLYIYIYMWLHGRRRIRGRVLR